MSKAINTEKQFLAQVKKLMKQNDFKVRFDNLITKAYKSGAIETSDLEEGNFSMASAVLSAVFTEMAWQYKPLSKEGRKNTDNLKNIL